MSGRYSCTKTKEKIEVRFNVKFSEDWKPRYNIAPNQDVPIITNKNKEAISIARWGLIPSWSLNDATGINLINAKSETILSRAPFKQLIYSNRCLILADGFYEWQNTGKKKSPFRFTLNNDEAFAFAGLWDAWDNGEDIINSFTIITTTANSLVKNIHERMPVILPADLEKDWLRDDLSNTEINNFLQPFQSDKMASYPVHRAVNSTTTDTLECIQVAPKIYPGETFSLFE